VSEPTRSARDIVGEEPVTVEGEPVNQARARLYERLMEAQERIAQARYRRGVANAAVQEALDQVDERLSDTDRREDLYLAALEHYVEALGGRLEVRAVFDEEAILLRPESGDGGSYKSAD
jgi:molybdopterin converting factor small subunit